MRPVIGITTFSETREKKSYCSVSNNYITSICAVGGIPLLLPLVNNCVDVADYLVPLDGLIFSGGEDVSPLLYGENPIREVELFSQERDEFEVNLFQKALEMDIPILGICRGLHIMNIAAGGTLYQDLFSQIENSLGHMPAKLPVDNLYHCLHIRENSMLEKIFGSRELKVNSYHHQSVKKLGKDIEISAWATDNVVEAIEHKKNKFVIGVQWHPEDLTVKHPSFLKLFNALVDASASYKTDKNCSCHAELEPIKDCAS